MKKRLIALLCVCLMMVSMVACNNSQGGAGEQEDGEKEKVTIAYWYWNGIGEQEYTDEVEAKLNEILARTEGTEHITIDLHPTADHGQEVALGQAGQEQIDLLSTPGLTATTEIQNGSFMELDDLLAKNSEAIDELPDWMHEAGKVNGKTYLVCNYQQATNVPYFIIPKEYLDMTDYSADDIINILRSIERGDDDAVDQVATMFENIVMAVREGTGKETKWVADVLGNPTFYRHYGQQELTLSWFDYFTYEDGEVLFGPSLPIVQKGYLKAGEFYDKGLSHPDSSTVSKYDYVGANFMNDESFCFYVDQGCFGDIEMASEYFTNLYGFETVAFPYWENNYVPAAVPAGGVGISSTCEHPEEAMQILAMLQNSKYSEFYNTLVYGIEGIHYEKLTDNTIKTLEFDGSQGGSDTTYAYRKWTGGNTFHAWVNQSSTPEIQEYILKEINESPSTIASLLGGFVFDTSSVDVEKAQIQATCAEYVSDTGSLLLGIKGAEGTKELLDEYNSKMEAAGLSTFLEELTKQANDYVKNK